VGEESESLINLFCTIQRHHLVFEILLAEESLSVPDNGIRLSQPSISLSPEIIGKLLILVMSDISDQWFDWQDNLFSNEDGKMTFQGYSSNVVW